MISAQRQSHLRTHVLERFSVATCRMTVLQGSVMNSSGNLQFPVEACCPNQLRWKPHVPGWEIENAISRVQWLKGKSTCPLSWEWPHSARAVMVTMGNLPLGIGTPDSHTRTGSRGLVEPGEKWGPKCNRKCRAYYKQVSNCLHIFIPKLVFLASTLLDSYPSLVVIAQETEWVSLLAQANLRQM